MGDPATGTTFDGNTTVVNVPAVTAPFIATSAFSAEVWVRPERHDTRYRYLWSRQTTDAAGRQGTGVWIRQTGIGFERFRDGPGSRRRRAAAEHGRVAPRGRHLRRGRHAPLGER